ncbi:hypothetical protein [Actinokineospora cianjurensis]|nr:hypothetical protein [Actinokineospora cianjurensis]
MTGDRYTDAEACLDEATQAIDSGAAEQLLARWITRSQELV